MKTAMFKYEVAKLYLEQLVISRTMLEKQRRYQSYLLRLWAAGEEENTIWRASLEDPLTGQRRGFASLDDLFDFLRQQTRGSDDIERRMNEQSQD